MKGDCIYFVEGKCEEVLILALKEQPALLIPGKIKVLNIIQNPIPRSILLSIRSGTTVVFVFDTDIPVTTQLRENAQSIKKYCSGAKVVFLPQVMNLEDELVRCTNVSKATELTHSKGQKDFKHDFCKLQDCRKTLEQHQLDVSLLWTKQPLEPFGFVPQNGNLVKRNNRER